MNYGRFFRLNQSLSKVVDGIAIYDYIDLPAYFGPSEENKLSPKYPVSVTITEDRVRFRLHYSVYKVDMGDYSVYGYNVEDIREAVRASGNECEVAHMEEVIIELPYRNDTSGILSSTIKDLYISKFPQRINPKDKIGRNSSGGRFLEQIIRNRFSVGGNINAKKLEREMYRSMQNAFDTLPSYSSLWLMDLLKKKDGKEYIDLYESVEDESIPYENRDIVALLRKLLLDFMFDIKHSDVFQNSRYYKNMYSGLMSEFYFSALMHKCEYYYCRQLILKEIESYEEINNQIEVDKKKSIRLLYADNFFKAEQIWVNDIISPQAEREFDFLYPKKDNPDRIDSNALFRQYSSIKSLFSFNNTFLPDQFRRWNSWFAPPEEEMKRVCFGMADEDTSEIHVCNTDTLATYLQITSNDRLDVEMRAIGDEIRGNVSRWFLRRYDFHDTAYFHLSKFSNWTLVGGLLSLILILFYVPHLVMPDIFDDEPLKTLQHYFPLFIILIFMMVGYVIYWLVWRKEKQRMCFKDKPLIKELLLLSKHRISLLFSILFLSLLFANTFVGGIIVVGLLVIFAFIFHVDLIHNIKYHLSKVISSLHLLFPRLVASITTAWLTITLGFDLYVSFFDKPVSLPTALFVSFVIIMFILFEVNRITPRVSLWKKTLRSVELLLISWCISILVGIVVIDFVGERFLERGGYVENYLSEYVVNEEGVEQLSKPITSVVDDRIRASLIDDLENYKPIVTKFYFGEHEVFYMRDFLFMFSFITMFMGIFLQMFIFDDKKMTEF